MATLAEFDPAAEGFEHIMGAQISGVYLLLVREEIVYIGQSINIPQRIASHLRARPAQPRNRANYVTKYWLTPNDIRGLPIWFDSVEVKWCEATELDKIERELILRLRPKYNRRIWQPAFAPPPDIDFDLGEVGLAHLKSAETFRRRLVA